MVRILWRSNGSARLPGLNDSMLSKGHETFQLLQSKEKHSNIQSEQCYDLRMTVKLLPTRK